jgi:hypothetical protein
LPPNISTCLHFLLSRSAAVRTNDLRESSNLLYSTAASSAS